MTSIEQYRAFNMLHDEFILTLIGFFPSVRKIQFYRELFHEFKKTDYRLPGRLFFSSVAPHSIHIFNRNDAYFMSGIEVTKTRDRAIIEKTIINEWQNMTPEQKDTVWFYLEKMLIVIMDIEDEDDEQDYKSVEQQATETLCKSFTNDNILSLDQR